MGAALRSRTRATRDEGPGLTSPLCSGPSGSSGVCLLPRSSPGVRKRAEGSCRGRLTQWLCWDNRPGSCTNPPTACREWILCRTAGSTPGPRCLLGLRGRQAGTRIHIYTYVRMSAWGGSVRASTCVCVCVVRSLSVCVSVLVCVYVVSCGSLRVHFCMCVSGRGLLGGLCDRVSV